MNGMAVKCENAISFVRNKGKKKHIENNELPPAHKGMKELVFVVQLAENTEPDSEIAKLASHIGGIRKIVLADGVTRYIAGCEFHSLEKAQFHLGKVKAVLHKNVRLVSAFRGKKITLEELEKKGFLKA